MSFNHATATFESRTYNMYTGDVTEKRITVEGSSRTVIKTVTAITRNGDKPFGSPSTNTNLLPSSTRNEYIALPYLQR